MATEEAPKLSHGNGDSKTPTIDQSSVSSQQPHLSTLQLKDYETQFFGFTPKSFSDGMYNAMLEYTWDSLDGARQYITQQFPDLVSKEEAEKAVDSIIARLTTAIDRAFDKFEVYVLTNVFVIPPHVLLPEDAPHRGQTYTEEDETRIDQEIQQLEEQITAAKYTNSCMRSELEDIARVQTAYEKLLTLQKKMEKMCADCGVPDLKEALVYCNEKALRIQKLLNKDGGLST